MKTDMYMYVHVHVETWYVKPSSDVNDQKRLFLKLFTYKLANCLMHMVHVHVHDIHNTCLLHTDMYQYHMDKTVHAKMIFTEDNEVTNVYMYMYVYTYSTCTYKCTYMYNTYTHGYSLYMYNEYCMRLTVLFISKDHISSK